MTRYEVYMESPHSGEITCTPFADKQLAVEFAMEQISGAILGKYVWRRVQFFEGADAIWPSLSYKRDGNEVDGLNGLNGF